MLVLIVFRLASSAIANTARKTEDLLVGKVRVNLYMRQAVAMYIRIRIRTAPARSEPDVYAPVCHPTKHIS